MANYTLTQHEYRYKVEGGSFTSWIGCTLSNTIDNGNGTFTITDIPDANIAIGDFQVRVKEISPNPPGNILANSTDFVATQLYLDDYRANIKGAYSTSKLFSDSTVSLRLRRTSDNAEMDFGFDGNNVLVDLADIESWSGSTEAFIVKIYDQSGNGFDLVQNTQANQPKILTSVLAGAYFGSSGSIKMITESSIFDTSFNESISILTLANKSSNDFKVHEAITSSIWSTWSLASGIESIRHANPNVTPVVNIVTESLDGTVVQTLFDAYVYDGLQLKQYINGSLYKIDDSTGNQNISGEDLIIGNYTSDGNSWDGGIFAKIYLNSVMQYDDIVFVNNKLKNDFGIGINKYDFYFAGNSLTEGAFATPGHTYPEVVVQGLGGTSVIDYVNAGTSGIHTNQIFIPPTRTNGFYIKNVLFFWELTNSLAQQGKTAEEAYDDMLPIIANAKQFGYRIIVLTVIPRTSFFSPPNDSANFEPRRIAVNNLVRGNTDIEVCDVANVFPFTESGVTLNTQYYVDETHLTDEGYAIIAQAVIDTFNS